MIAKFVNKVEDQVMELEKSDDGVVFYITQCDEDSIGQSITISYAEVPGLIKFLTESLQKSLNLHQ